ncbi:MAG TPA: MraY family glycosyltransferase [Spongiibacteraceae bacterium]|nr:MraY family glycosyltransferase [Spongiibacteraceae bacterium]
MNLSILELLYSFTVALFLTTALIPLCIRLAPQLGLVDTPNESRKVHSHAIPRSGGLAMALGIIIPLLWFLPADKELFHLCVGGLVIVAFGLMDDSKNLNYKWKFLGQILATLIVMRGGLVLQHLPLMWVDDLPMWITYPLTFFFILGIINAVNLTDGLDGLAAGTTLLALAILLALSLQTEQKNAAFIALTVIGGILGFLRYNTHPAQVFMGDTGSQSLGFIAACLSIGVTQSPLSAASVALPLLILGLPVLDTLTVIAIRVAQGRSPFSPDRNHLHHQIMALGFRHNEAVAIIYLLQIALLALAFSLRFEPDRLLLGVYVLFCLALIGVLQLARRSGWRLRSDDTQPSWIDRRNIFLRRLEWFYRNSGLIVQSILAILLITPALSATSKLSSLTLILLPLLIIAMLAYKRFPGWATRLCVYPASVLSVYLISSNTELEPYLWVLNAGYILLAATLAVAIRMTRREHFRLDTQDLLVLILILAVPLMPFESLSHYAIGEITLRLAVLMYSCEFIISKTSGKTLLPVNIAAVVSLLLMTTLHILLSLV